MLSKSYLVCRLSLQPPLLLLLLPPLRHSADHRRRHAEASLRCRRKRDASGDSEAPMGAGGEGGLGPSLMLLRLVLHAAVVVGREQQWACGSCSGGGWRPEAAAQVDFGGGEVSGVRRAFLMIVLA